MPVLGWLFKNKSEAVSKQELLIFLTPSIIKT
jgi:type IV pilus assembly protein PilQ